MKIDERMKEYEFVNRTYLTRRVPVIIRIDGRAFHSFCNGFDKPFDQIMVLTMQETMKYLCENIQGCILGYTQSDEITLVLTDYSERETCAWFDNNVSKIISISASMATLVFNRIFNDKVNNYSQRCITDEKTESSYFKALEKGAMFDSRCFNIPKEEVINCLIWRQQDATRNSILALAQSHFSHKEMQNKKCNILQDMLILNKGINWNDLATTLKRGSCCIKKEHEVQTPNGIVMRNKWVIDNEIPIFTADKEYVEKLL